MPRIVLANSPSTFILPHTHPSPLLSSTPPQTHTHTHTHHRRLLQKCSLVQTSKVLERDTQHQELAKLRLSQDQLNTTLQEQREEIQRLTQHINTTEQQLNRVSLVVLEAGQWYTK